MTGNNSRKAVIYCRVSSKKQTLDGHGLDSQEHRCRKYAYERDYEVVAVFQDDITGEGDFMKRPGMVALLAYLDAQPAENFVVIFDDLKQYARDVEFHLKLKREMSIRNAQRECLNFKFEETPEGEFIETVLAAQGELERKQNSRQVIQKMKARVESGFWVFPAPVGYRYEKVSGQGKLMVRNEPNASIVQEVLEGYASGRFGSQTEAARFLAAYNVIPVRQNGDISRKRIKDILTNPLYAGYMTLPRWDIVMSPAKHEPLISFETYKIIQDRLNTVAQAPIRKDIHEDFPLRGFVTCASCGTPMTAAWSKGKYKKYPYYLCRQKGCVDYRKSISKDKIEKEFETLLDDLKPSRDLFMMAANIFKDLWVYRTEASEERHAAMKKELNAIDRKVEQFLNRIVEAENKTVISAYEKHIQELEENKIILREKIVNCGRPSDRPAFK